MKEAEQSSRFLIDKLGPATANGHHSDGFRLFDGKNFDAESYIRDANAIQISVSSI